MKTLRVLSYNIHKGFSTANLKFILDDLKHSIRSIQADLVFLQEVLGHHDVHGQRLGDWPTTSQFEFLADKVWPHYAYGKNAVYSSGHHGNAILSKYPFQFWENIDVSTNRFEGRGILHGVVELPRGGQPLHVICIHLALLETWREAQIETLCDRIDSHVPPDAPLVVAGDFNDWREKATKQLRARLHLDEAFLSARGRHARTYPIWFPVLKLDRVYCRGLEVGAARCLTHRPWNGLSDHAALCVDLKF